MFIKNDDHRKHDKEMSTRKKAKVSEQLLIQITRKKITLDKL